MAVGERTVKRVGIFGRIFMTLFFGVFLAMGLGFFAMMVPTVLKDASTHAWSEVECTIVESSFQLEGTVEGGAAGWRVRYSYVFDGREFVGSMLNTNTAVSDDRNDLRRSQQLAPGTRTTCYVNPRDPAEAVLERASLWTLLTPLFPLIFVAVGAGGIWLAWRRDGGKAESTTALTARAESGTKSERRGLIVGMAFGGVFLVVGVAMANSLLVEPVVGVVSARSWPETPCEVVSSEVVSHDSDDGTTYSVAITYRYEVGGRMYLSNRYRFMGGSSSGYRAKAQIVKRHRPGSWTTCYVNPDDPTDAVLDRAWSGTMWLGLVPVFFALIGGGIMAGMWRQWRKPAIAGGRTSAFSGAASTRMRGGLPPAAGSSPTVRSASGPVVLEPTTSRTMRIVATAIAAVFWNGIVSIFVFQLFSDGWSGFSWFLALFLTPFVLIGFGLIGVVLRQILGLSNPVPRLTVNRRELCPGDTFEVAWEMHGRVHALRRLRIIMEGREEATYRRGTDTRTDREVFASLVIVDTSNATDLSSGRAVLRLPPRTMHSFTAKNNKVVWLLRVKGDIPRWPDIDEEFSITLIAPPGVGGLFVP